MRAAIVAILFALGFAAGWTWRGDRCEAQVATWRAQTAQALETITTEARKTEAAQDSISRRIDDAYQKDLARLAARPVARKPTAVLGVRKPAATETAARVPAPAEGAAIADAATAYALPDSGRDQFMKDAERTALMLYRLQEWVRAEGMADD